MPQTSPLHDGDGLGDGRASAGEVETAHPRCGHLAESDAVSKEQDDEPVGLVLAFIETAMLAHILGGRTPQREPQGLGVGQEALLLGRARELTPVATLRAKRPSLTAMLRISESTGVPDRRG